MPTTADLERRLGWHFANADLLRQALTHSTYTNENAEAGAHNERLEFLGDAVLSLLSAQFLFKAFSEFTEGELSRGRARLVRGEALTVIARKLALSEYLRVGGRDHLGKISDRVLENAVEALVGAVFLDGGLQAAQTCFEPYFREALEDDAPEDYKSVLQELCHRRGVPAPEYRVVRVEGPDHARAYVCEVIVDKNSLGSGQGTSRKQAEQQCAQRALEILRKGTKNEHV